MHSYQEAISKFLGLEVIFSVSAHIKTVDFPRIHENLSFGIVIFKRRFSNLGPTWFELLRRSSCDGFVLKSCIIAVKPSSHAFKLHAVGSPVESIAFTLRPQSFIGER
jgi:hypothetical protein